MALARSPSPVRLIAFDLDGTLVSRTVFIWSTLHEHFGSDPMRRQQAHDDFFAGRISYRDWFDHDLQLLTERDATRDAILACFADLHPAPNAERVLNTLKQRGYHLGLISGSLDVLLDHFFPSHPFDHVMINRLFFDDQGRIAGGRHTPYDLSGKADGLREMARREGLSLAQCAFVGDNINDMQVMEAAGFAVGVHIKHPDVERVVDHIIDGSDLSALLGLFPGVD